MLALEIFSVVICFYLIITTFKNIMKNITANLVVLVLLTTVGFYFLIDVIEEVIVAFIVK